MIVPVHLVGYSNMMNSINGNTQSQTVYFRTVEPEKKARAQKTHHRMFSIADVPLLTVAAISSKPKTLSAFAKSFTRLPIAILGLTIPGSIATGVTSKVIENRAKKGKETSPVLAMTGFGAMWYGLYKAGAAGIAAIKSKIPETYKRQAAEGIKDLSNIIDSSKANKKVYEPIANKVGKVFKAHPQIRKPAMVAASIAAFAICLLPSIKRNRQAEKELQQQRRIEQFIQSQQAQELARMKELQNIFAAKQQG